MAKLILEYRRVPPAHIDRHYSPWAVASFICALIPSVVLPLTAGSPLVFLAAATLPVAGMILALIGASVPRAMFICSLALSVNAALITLLAMFRSHWLMF